MSRLKRTVSVAPMMDCTDKHERFFLRLISKNVLLYTEMIVSEAIDRGDKKKLLKFDILQGDVDTEVLWYTGTSMCRYACLYQVQRL